MKPFIKIIIVVTIASLYCARSIAQNPLASFPTPEASELGKYGQVPVSYFNGLPEISIPIYTMKCKDISVPISLSYYAGGNKPDEHPGWVGLGWNLKAGGMITRVVNGMRDELTKEDFPSELGGKGTFRFESGYYYRASDMNNNDWSTPEFLAKLVNDVSFDNMDTEPDEFIFNFNGYSGSFYMTNINGYIDVKVKNKNGDVLKVEPILSTSYIDFPVFQHSTDYDKYAFNVTAYKTFQKFIVTTKDGMKYEFGGSVDNIDFTTSSREIAMASSWHLSKIISPNGSYVNFAYAPGGDIIVQKKANYFYASANSGDNQNFCTLSRNDDVEGLSLVMIHPKYLKSITSSAKENINFITSKTTELDYPSPNDNYLKYLKVINSLLPRIGWNNSRLNDHYYLQLDRIEIGGIKWANFFYSNSASQRLRLLGLSLTPPLGIVTPLTIDDPKNEIKYTFTYNSTNLPIYNSRKIDNWGFYNNKDFSTISFSNYSTMFDFRKPNLAYAKAEILEQIKYPTGGRTVFEYELNDYSQYVSGLDVTSTPFSLINSTGQSGGLRIKKISSFDSGDLIPKTSKTYVYTKSDGSSSGILSGIPTYYSTGNQHVKYNITAWPGLFHYSVSADYVATYYMYSQNMILPLSTTNGSHNTYSRVKEIEEDGSYTVYNYTNHDEFPDLPPVQVLTNFDNRLLFDSFTSREIERGLLKKMEVYNSSNAIVKKVINEYNDSPGRYDDYVKIINRNVTSGGRCSGAFLRYSANKIFSFYPYLKKKKDILYSANDSTISETKFAYNSLRILSSRTENDSRGDSISVSYRYPFSLNIPWLIQIGYDSVSAIGMCQSLFLNYPIEIIKYKNNKVIESSYFEYGRHGTTYSIDKIYKLETSSPISNFTPFDGVTLDTRYQKQPYLSMLYDGMSNVIQSIGKDNMPTTYLWGYNYQYPIAEIKNATYDQVKTALSEALITRLATNAIPLPTDFATLKALHTSTELPNAQVSTYGYRPFVGMISATAPNGVNTYYVYDAFNRLIRTYIVENGQPKTIQSYDYHYKQ